MEVNMALISNILETYEKFVKENEDQRTKDLPLMRNPIPVLIVIAFYVSFCVNWGPKIMANRKPFQLKNTLLVYNAANVIVSIWMTYEALASGWWNDYSYRCQLMDYTDNPKAKRMALLSWIYFFCKLIELLDTVFFVLRKKNNQVTFLHMYHHTMMPICTYLMTKFLPGGQLTFGIMANSFIHSIMYSYYLLASLGPKYQKYLRLKPWVTRLQLIQFVLILLHQLQVFVTDCSFPKAIPSLQIGSVFFLFCMFFSFYQRSYNKSDGKDAADSNKNGFGSTLFTSDGEKSKLR